MTTEPRTMTSKPTPDPPEGTTRAKWLDLSLTQLIGSSMAAATAAFLGSRLGLVGTIAGAAVGSLISATAASVYIGSLHRARTALLAARRLAPHPASTPQQAPQQAPQQSPLDGWRPIDRIGSRRLLATAGAVFALAAAFLTGLQLASGTNVTGTTIGTRTALVAPHDIEVKPVQVAPTPTGEPSSPTATPTPGAATVPEVGPTQPTGQPSDQAAPTTDPAAGATVSAPPAVTDPTPAPAPTSPAPAPTAPAN